MYVADVKTTMNLYDDVDILKKEIARCTYYDNSYAEIKDRIKTLESRQKIEELEKRIEKLEGK